MDVCEDNRFKRPRTIEIIYSGVREPKESFSEARCGSLDVDGTIARASRRNKSWRVLALSAPEVVSPFARADPAGLVRQHQP